MMPAFQPLLRLTFQAPQEAARQILAMRLPGQVAWMALIAMTVLGVVLSYMSALIAGAMGDMANPLMLATVLAVATFVMVYAVSFCGKVFDGEGSPSQAAALFAWLQVVQNISIAVQMVAILVLPVLAGGIAIATFILVLWMLLNFVSVLHGLNSLGKAFVVLLLAVVGISLVVTLAMSLAGVSVEGL